MYEIKLRVEYKWTPVVRMLHRDRL